MSIFMPPMVRLKAKLGKGAAAGRPDFRGLPPEPDTPKAAGRPAAFLL